MSATSLQNIPLHEKYRPRKWGEVIGQDDALKKLAVIRDRGGNRGGNVATGTDGAGEDAARCRASFFYPVSETYREHNR